MTIKHYLQFTSLTADEYAYVFTRAALIKLTKNITRWLTAPWP
jgi:hypothetical protein